MMSTATTMASTGSKKVRAGELDQHEPPATPSEV